MKKSEKILKLINQLQEGVYEKQTIFNLSVLAMLGQESIFLLGLPGVAKSLVSRRLKYAFKSAHNFEYLMNRFSTPEELFGPISITSLQKGSYERNIEGYLPTCEIVFLDEIWKASPSIQNTLLTIINEKLFRNGGKDINVPLKLLMSASNELPAEGEGLEALFDRFLIRYIVKGINSEALFNQMISGITNLSVNIDPSLQISDEEYSTWLAEIPNIKLDMLTYNFINRFRRKINEVTKNTAYISDRRWKKIAHLMKVSAYFNDRTTVDKSDWLIISYCIWDNEEEYVEYNKIFSEFYVESLTFEFTNEKQKLNNEIEKIKKELINLGDNELIKQVYTNPLSRKLRGKYYRIISSDLEEPINFISVSDFNKIKKNQYGVIAVHGSDDLSHLKQSNKITLNYVDERSIQNSDSKIIYKLEIADSEGSDHIQKLQQQILDIEVLINDLNKRLSFEKKRLAKQTNIFLNESFQLMINQAFANEEIPLDIENFKELVGIVSNSQTIVENQEKQEIVENQEEN